MESIAPKGPTERQRSAHHEAGHAVAARLRGLNLQEVRVTPSSRRHKGATRIAYASTPPTSAWKLAHGHDRAQLAIEILCAGMVAAVHMTADGESEADVLDGAIDAALDGVGDDFRKARELMAEIHDGPADWRTLDPLIIDGPAMRVCEELRRPQNWAAVRALAGALERKGRVNGRRAQLIIDRAIASASTLAYQAPSS